MNISVFKTKRILGLKRYSDLRSEEILSQVVGEPTELEDALTRQWDSDAHMCMYVAEDEDGDAFHARINKGAFPQQLEQEGGCVLVRALVFDHDLPRTEDAAKQEWSADGLESFLGDLNEALGGTTLEPTAWYTTLHGSRFVYALTKPVQRMDAEAMMIGIMDEFARRGIMLDRACKDWTRLFRLPNVVREEYGRYESEVLTGGPALDPANAPRGEVLDEELQGEVSGYEGVMPDPDECVKMMTRQSENGRIYASDLVKRAKIMLQGRAIFGVVFEHAPLVKGQENWNSQIFEMVGSLVGMMAGEEVSSPEALYALLHPAIEQLQDLEMNGANATDWYTTVWDHICRLWAKEDAKLNAQALERERLRAEARIESAQLLENVRSEHPAEVPDDDEEATEWFRRRMIASSGRHHYVMNHSGSYNLIPVGTESLIPMINDLGMQDMIPVTEYRGKTVGNRNPRDILAEHSTPVGRVIPSALAEVAHIDGPSGDRVLTVPVHRLNPKLNAVYDQRVADWLDALGGTDADMLVEWLSHALDVKRPICALNLFGAPGTGKGMLALGLSECFDGEAKNDGRALGQWNGGLLDSPVVNCDEGVPKVSGSEALTLDQAFRALVTGGNVTIRRMHTNPYNANIYPRIIFTSNDRDILRAIVGHRDLTDQDTEAIELRLLSIDVENDAQMLLTSKGNYQYTRGWVAGDKPSEYTLANHIYALYKNRKTSQRGSGRLLVEGVVGTQLVKDLRMSTKGSEVVLRTLLKLIDRSHGGTPELTIFENGVYTTAAKVADFAEQNLMVQGGLSLKNAAKQLMRFSERPKRDVEGKTAQRRVAGQKGRFFELDLGLIYEQALIHGMVSSQLTILLQNQEGGREKIAAIEATA